jgi:ABC-type transport system involved in multi-copper enzyme maturation permease subunit
MARAEPVSRTAGIAALLRKDWAVFQPRFRAAVVLVFVLGALQTIRSDEAFFWLAVVLAAALVGFVPAVEWRQGTDRLVASLPVSRESVVAGRYIVALLAIAASWLAWLAAGALLTPVLLAGRTDGPWATLSGGLAFLLLAGILVAGFLLLYFLLGFGRTALLFAPVTLVVALAARTVAMTLAGPPPMPDGLPPMLTPVGGAVRFALDALIARAGPAGAATVVGAAFVGCLAVSGWIATRAFRRRGL